MEPTEASIGHHFKEVLGRSPHGEIRTCLIKDAAITLHWAVGRRCAADAGDDSDDTWARQAEAEVGTQVPHHIDDEVHRLIACGHSRSEVKTTQGFFSSDSQPNVIRPTPKPRTSFSTTGASPPKKDWQTTGSWPPWCASPSKDSSFPMEGRDLESICKAAVRRIDECLEEAAEVIKSIQLSWNGRRESTTRGLQFKPVNLYGSKWLQRIEDSSELPKVKSPVMRKDYSTEDFAKCLIFEEMARFSQQQQQFNQNLKTPSCLTKPNIGYEKADLDQLESECNVSNPSCQTPRECQTRSPDSLKKSSMNEHAQQTSATSKLDLPQSGSEDDDETWLIGSTGCKTTTTIKVPASASSAAEACRAAEDPFHRHSKTQPVAEPQPPRTRCDLPGPQSQDDDEDSSPVVQELDRAEHTQCSSNNHPSLMLSRGASAHGSEEFSSGDTCVTPAKCQIN